MYDSSTLTPVASPTDTSRNFDDLNNIVRHNGHLPNSTTTVNNSAQQQPHGTSVDGPPGSPDDSDYENTRNEEFWFNLEPGRQYKDTLQLQHFGPLADLIPVGKVEPAQGHDFQTLRLVNPTWCDKCGDFIMGFVKQALRCECWCFIDFILVG